MRLLQVFQERSSAAVRERLRVAILRDVVPDAEARWIARAVFRAADDEAERLVARDCNAKPDCAPGCASCCHVHVEATDGEVHAVVENLAASRSRAQLDELVTRLERSALLGSDERWEARIPCAFLAADNTCSIHAVRPLRCRAFHSYSVGTCRDAFAGHTAALPQQRPALTQLYQAAEEVLNELLLIAGHGTECVTLEAAVLRRLAARLVFSSGERPRST